MICDYAAERFFKPNELGKWTKEFGKLIEFRFEKLILVESTLEKDGYPVS